MNSKMVYRILEMLIVAGIVGGITLWGNNKVVQTELKFLNINIAKVEASINTLSGKLDAHIIHHNPTIPYNPGVFEKMGPPVGAKKR